MSSDTSGSAPSSSGSETTAGRPGPSAPGLIRDFVYLNQDRIFSYLSQMDGGLKLLYSKVRDDGWSETLTSDEKTTSVGVSATGSIEGKLAFLGSMTGDLTGEWNHSVSTGGDARTDSERRVTADLFGLHHRAYDLVMDRLGHRFTTATGRIYFVHTDSFLTDVKDFQRIIDAIKALGHSVGENAPKGMKQMHFLLEHYLKGQTLVLLKTSEGHTFTSYLPDRYFLQPPFEVITDFGASPSLQFTLTGILSPPHRAIHAGLHKFHNYVEEAKDMAEQLPVLAGHMENIREYFKPKATDRHLVPIALFTEL